MLRNSLAPITSRLGIVLPDYWGKLRPEVLKPDEFVELAHYLQECSDVDISKEKTDGWRW